MLCQRKSLQLSTTNVPSATLFADSLHPAHLSLSLELRAVYIRVVLHVGISGLRMGGATSAVV